jgi:hypothetical protein
MREWSLHAGDPLSLTFSADTRFCKPDYLNDHIWELDLGGGEPAALAVHTSYGLRARGMRLFYRFTESATAVTAPADFHVAPSVRRFYPNFFLLHFVPLEGLEVTAEYWIPESHVLAGRLTFINRLAARKLRFELCGALNPLDGKSLAPTQQQMVNVLTGSTGGLAPVLFMTGGALHGPGPHPSLALNLDFDPGMTRTIAWAFAAESSPEASFELARRTAARSWDAERAKIELRDAGDLLEIYTGDTDWDATLAFSQKTALSLFYTTDGPLPAPSFVRTRQPDGGYSRLGNGTDYSSAWNGQSAFDAYYLAAVLPSAERLKRGLLENFLSVQSDDGAIDAKPGLAGQRSKFLAAPILASLAWNLYQQEQDESFLAQVFPKLLAFFENWVSPAHDRDGDGLPEWDHVLQTGFDDHPLFDGWHPWSQALAISTFYNPELEALLYREAASLILMAERLGRDAEGITLRQRAARLQTSVLASWNADRSLYMYRERLSGASSPGRLLGRRKGSGELHLEVQDSEPPVRLVVEVRTQSASAKRPLIEIVGHVKAPSMITPQPIGAAPEDSGREHDDPEHADGVQSEHLEEQDFQRHTGGWVAVSQMLYSGIERIEAEGLEDTDELVVRTVDSTTEDITLFTPLWARLPDHDQARAMLSRLFLDGTGFDRPFGIPALPSSPAASDAAEREAAEADAVAMSVHLPWNQLIGEGLLAYGFRAEAAQLTTRLMGAVIHCLKHSRTFYESYHAGTASGLGERGAVAGLAPVGLFLQALGVTILSTSRVRLEGTNPFPWPVTILYRGLKIARGPDATEVSFPNGQVVTVTDPAPHVVSV